MARPLPDRGGVASEVLATGEARSVRRAGADPAALIVAPLRGRERVLGILHLKRLGEHVRFEAREFDVVRLFAAQGSIALQNALTHRAVELRAQTDALTGLRNHGTFREDLQADVLEGDPFALVMLDIDDFKVYNDRHGHEAGNELLQAIATAIGAACRDSDRVYRYGGDEFCVIAPKAGPEDAVEVGERVRAAVRGLPGASGGEDHMRASVGVAAFPVDAVDREGLLLAADRALYAAKRAGRDRVGTATDGLALAADFVAPHTPVDDVSPAVPV